MLKRFTDFQKTMFCFSFFSVIVLFLAVFFDFAYGFYTFLRLIVCVSICMLIADMRNVYFRFVLIVVAILYNPIAPIHLGDRDIWIVINLLTIPLIVAAEILSIWRILKNGTTDQR